MLVNGPNQVESTENSMNSSHNESSVEEASSGEEIEIDQLINKFGFGMYQVRLLSITGLCLFVLGFFVDKCWAGVDS